MVAVWIILGLALGLVIGFLLAERRGRSAQTEHAVTREQARLAAAQLTEHQQQLGDHRRDLASLQQERAGLDAQLSAEKNSVAQHRQFHADALRQVEEAVVRFEALRGEMGELRNQHAATVAKLDAEKQSLAAEREHFSDAKARVREAFAELSGEALQKNSQQFFDLATQTFKTLQTEATGGLEEKKAAIAQLVQPMTALLDQYKQSVDKIEVARGEAFTNIQRELAAVAATQQNLSTETRQLVTALRRPQGRGQWGEMTLKRLFEMAGLTARVSFDEQVSLTTEEGRLRPDCIVRMPQGRHVIVDSKCVLDAFLDASSAADDAQRGVHMVRHAQQVRSRVSDLANKNYSASFKGSAEFTILFLPGEAFLYAAVEQDPKIIEDALRQHILIAAPSTLLGMLRVIDHAWRQQEIEDNAKEIRKQAEELYKRLATLSEHFERLGGALTGATKAYNATLGSLERNVFTQARRMAELGVSGSKPIKSPEDIEEAVRDTNLNSWNLLPETTMPKLTLAESSALESDPIRSAEAS